MPWAGPPSPGSDDARRSSPRLRSIVGRDRPVARAITAFSPPHDLSHRITATFLSSHLGPPGARRPAPVHAAIACGQLARQDALGADLRPIGGHPLSGCSPSADPPRLRVQPVLQADPVYLEPDQVREEAGSIPSRAASAGADGAQPTPCCGSRKARAITRITTFMRPKSPCFFGADFAYLQDNTTLQFEGRSPNHDRVYLFRESR
jgi:hypothetical protein